jgi:hypothetical protein
VSAAAREAGVGVVRVVRNNNLISFKNEKDARFALVGSQAHAVKALMTRTEYKTYGATIVKQNL